ncbi:Uncharacterised protein [Vibrio cholerae]|nr:Uncharacterised protein [Vibrio cholerae]CSB93078.1 Uncharacterised protein [Vibrio cholerae]CSC83498.1 Uncharacterised protein [Vibrio cholerae]
MRSTTASIAELSNSAIKINTKLPTINTCSIVLTGRKKLNAIKGSAKVTS